MPASLAALLAALLAAPLAFTYPMLMDNYFVTEYVGPRWMERRWPSKKNVWTSWCLYLKMITRACEPMLLEQYTGIVNLPEDRLDAGDELRVELDWAHRDTAFLRFPDVFPRFLRQRIPPRLKIRGAADGQIIVL